MTLLSIGDLIYVFAGLVFCILLLYGYLIVKSLEQKRNLHFQNKYEEKVRKHWEAYLIGNGVLKRAMIPRSNKECLYAEEMMISYFSKFSSDVMKNKMMLFMNQFMVPYYQSLLESRRSSDKVRALYFINSFQIDPLFETCMELERYWIQKHRAYMFLKFVSIKDERKFFQYFIQYSALLSEYEVKSLLLSISDPLFEGVKRRAGELAEEVHLNLIETIGFRGSKHDLSLLEKWLESTNEEVRIRTLKTMHKLRLPLRTEKMIFFVYSELWQERLMAARILEQKLPEDEDWTLLTHLAHDRHFLVRRQACETMKLKNDGVIRLQQLIETSSDSYTIDMATEVLNRRGIG